LRGMRITNVMTYFFKHKIQKILLFSKATILINENYPVALQTLRIFLSGT